VRRRSLKRAQAGLGSVPSTSAKWKLGKVGHQREMLPPGVFTSTGTLMA
jgi:hypothetical protein